MRREQLSLPFPPPPPPSPVVWKGKTYPPGTAVPDPQRIREKLASYQVQIASGAANERDRRMIATVVPQMVRALPDDEAAKWLAAFGFEPLNSEQKGQTDGQS